MCINSAPAYNFPLGRTFRLATQLECCTQLVQAFDMCWSSQHSQCSTAKQSIKPHTCRCSLKREKLPQLRPFTKAHSKVLKKMTRFAWSHCTINKTAKSQHAGWLPSIGCVVHNLLCLESFGPDGTVCFSTQSHNSFQGVRVA